MGMFDYIRFECPIPVPQPPDGEFQTKDTPEQFLDNYKVDKDGLLWHQAYDIEDHSDPNAEGIMKMVGFAARVNGRWVRSSFTGKLGCHSRDHEFEATFVDGVMRVPTVPGRREIEPDERSGPIEILRWITRCAHFDGPHGGKVYAIKDSIMALARKRVEDAFGKEDS